MARAGTEKRVKAGQQKKSDWRSLPWLPVLLAAMITGLRLLPTPPSLDATIASNRTGPPQAEFPGSAFFTMEDAVTAAPAALRTDASEHVLRLDTGPAAPSAMFRGLTAVDRQRATTCLASAIYYEAGRESEDGQRAVAQVILNRLRHPAWPNTVCEVVYQGSERTDQLCQFTFSCDGAMARLPGASWEKARQIAREALAGHVFAPVGLATSYHSLAVRPAWAAYLRPVAVVGAHIFYRLPGSAGEPVAFTDRYRGFEPVAGPSTRLTWPPLLPIAATDEPVSGPAPFMPPAPVPTAATAAAPGLPSSTVRPEYRDSGQIGRAHV